VSSGGKAVRRVPAGRSPKACPVCGRPDRARLDERLALDLDTVRSLAAAEGLPVGAVWWHRARHLDAEWMGPAEQAGAPVGVEQLRNIAVSDLHDVREIARDAYEKSRTRVEAHGAARSWVELLMKFPQAAAGDGGGDVVDGVVVAEFLDGLLERVAGLPGGRAVADEYLEQVARTIMAVEA
jgi:hypothetical protein